MHPPIRYAIIRFCSFFKSICSKEIILQELDNMQAELVVTLCLLKKFFPSSFSDIMIHLTVHLTREVKLYGPICFRCMYPFERCMKVIKGHMRNINKPEGWIAEETIVEETIESFSEYHKSIETIGIPPNKHKTDENEEGKPLSAVKSSEVSMKLFQKAHFHVVRELAISKESVLEIVSGVSVEAIYLHISKEVATTRQAFYYGVLKEIWVLDYRFRKIPIFKCDWVNHRVGGVTRNNLGCTLVDLNNLGHKVVREVSISKESVSEIVRWISYGPRATIVKYDSYNINGYTFRTKCHDGKVYQNSGVSVEAIDLHISKEVATTRQAFYYGVLKEIWVLDYRFKKIPLFKCDWVNHRVGGVTRDNLGCTLVDLNNLGHK
nr:hypothetical protein [Tanacetum cinerariifolium]